MDCRRLIGALLLTLALTLGGSIREANAESSRTLWEALGIPQLTTGIFDSSVNRTGRRPDLERGWRLRRIADSSNLESEDLILRRAAEIKQAEDLADQKIKAVRYVASVGCGCYQGTDEVLIAALEDCTEAVRFAAAQAIGEHASRMCGHCDQRCCCSKEVLEKLVERAYGRDAQGCWIEDSPRVRAAAEWALLTCCPGCPYTLIEEEPEAVEERDRAPRDLDPREEASRIQLRDLPTRFASHQSQGSSTRRVGNHFEGRIVKLDPEASTVVVQHAESFIAMPSGEGTVHRAFLLGRYPLGRVRVLQTVAGQTKCEVVSSNGGIREGDIVTLLGYRVSSQD